MVKYSLYNIYLSNTLELARSMVIRLDWVARCMNRELIELGQPVRDDRRTWRYYLHLAGEYHSFDTPMMVTSLDTGEEILFSKENLKRHKKTRSVYLYNRQYVDVLKRKYPRQTNLVRGVLWPVALERAVSSPDGTILHYDSDKVEPQEHDLIYETEKWIRGFHYRFLMEAFVETDDLFVATMTAKLYAFLPVQLLDIRERYLKTAQTHSFHILSYLASHQRLDEFAPYLTHGQLLFLYRNILYLERHTGMQDSFNTLLRHLMTVRLLPTYSYDFRQKDMDLAAGQLSPTPVFGKQQLNLRTGLSGRDLIDWSVDDLLYKEVALATDNHRFLEEYLEETKRLGSRSAVSQLPTKVLEVSAIDPEDMSAVKLPDVLINEWLFMAGSGRYNTALDIINPLNGDMIRMNPSELFLLFAYAHAQGFHGATMDKIPQFLAMGVNVNRWISDDEYLAVLGPDPFHDWDEELEFYAKTTYETDAIAVPEELAEHAIKVYNRKRVRWEYVYQRDRWTDRVARKTMFKLNYVDVWCDLRQPHLQTYQDLFLRIALDAEKMSMEAWQDIAMQALNIAVQFDSQNRISLSDIQAAMVRLFKRLSSYTIQFIEDMASEDRVVARPWHCVPGNTFAEERGIGTMHSTSTLLYLHGDVRSRYRNWHQPQRVLDYEEQVERRASVEYGQRALWDARQISHVHGHRQTCSAISVTLQLGSDEINVPS